MVFRVSAVDGHSYVPSKFLINVAHSWSKEVTDPSGKLMSHDLVARVNVVGRKLIHLNEFFRVARVIIPVDVASLELVWPPNLSEWSCQSTEFTFSHWSDVLR